MILYLVSANIRRIAKNFENFIDKFDDKYFIVIFFVLINFFAQIVISSGHNWGGDFSQYIAQARAVSNGEIHAWLDKQSFIAENSIPGLCPLIYPWGTALIILPLYKIFGINFYAFKCLMALFLAGSWVIFYLFLRLKFGKAVSATLTAILMLNVYYIWFIDNVLSEMPFLFFSFATIFFIYKRKLSDKKLVEYSILIGVLLFFSIQLRSLGIALLIALIFDDIISIVMNFRRKILTREKIISTFTVYALPYIIFFILRVILLSNLPYISVQKNTGYLVFFSLRPDDILNQIISYTKLFGNFFMPLIDFKFIFNWFGLINENLICTILSTLFLFTVLVGMIKKFSVDRYIIFYFVITLATLCTFNTAGGLMRYIFGIIPFALYFSFYGINFIAKKFNVFKLRDAVFFSVIVTTLLFNIKFITGFRHIDIYQAYSKEALATYEFINENISDEKIIFFFKPRVLYLNTNVYAYFGGGGEENLNLADYVLFNEDDSLDDLKKIVANSPKYELTYCNEKFVLYKILKD